MFLRASLAGPSPQSLHRTQGENPAPIRANARTSGVLPSRLALHRSGSPEGSRPDLNPPGTKPPAGVPLPHGRLCDDHRRVKGLDHIVESAALKNVGDDPTGHGQAERADDTIGVVNASLRAELLD